MATWAVKSDGSKAARASDDFRDTITSGDASARYSRR